MIAAKASRAPHPPLSKHLPRKAAAPRGKAALRGEEQNGIKTDGGNGVRKMEDKNRNNIRNVSRMLRKNMTRQERRLWYDFLKKLSIPVYRQKPLGNYVVDFYIARVRLVIELDGSQHYHPKGRMMDEKREAYLAETGNLTARYSNYDVDTNFEGVCLDLIRIIRERGMGDDWQPFGE